MKKRFLPFHGAIKQLVRHVLLFILTITFAGIPLSLSSQEEIKTTEKVSVVNIEVPVRVFYKGRAVDDLKKSDFKLYEGKERQEIHGFYKVKKKIKIKDPKLLLPSRYFVLVFRITEYNDALKKGLDYVFRDILKRNDQLLVFVNDKTLFIKNLLDKEQAFSLIDKTLREESARSRHLMTKYLLKIKQLLEDVKLKLGAISFGADLIPVDKANYLLDFLNRYLITWKEYKNRYLVPDMDSYYNFARFLEKIRMEKWVISFYQVELFPKLQLSGDFLRMIDHSVQAWLMGRSEDMAYARKITVQLHLIDRELNAAENFPAGEISKLFFKVGATFHSILMTVHREANVRDLEFKNLSTDIENSLREITAKTGGELMATNNLEKALSKVVEKEDICYMLTYAPENPGKKGKISVELGNRDYRKYDVIYDKNMREDYIREYLAKKNAGQPTVELNEIKFKGKKLSFRIGGFLMKKTGKEKMGKLGVRIRVKDRRSQPLYDKKKQIEAKQETIAFSLAFDWLNAGEYNIIVDVQDLLTGKNASSFLQPVIK
ncbi:MAG: hypothetical protein KAT34_01950 [Candidatus Aminicenantes bacterium]|nr:hypothetical protein [Candidatus Aminicenantes bacterium]